MRTNVKINNINVSNRVIKWVATKDKTKDIDITIINFVPSVLNDIEIKNGDFITIKRGITTGEETTKFIGQVENTTSQQTLFVCNCKGKLFDLWRKSVTTTYLSTGTQAGKISEIFKDLVTTYAGLRATSQSIQDSGTVNTLERFRCTRNRVIDKCKQLRDVLDWQFYYDYDLGNVRFEPRGNTVFTTDLVVGRNIINIPRWARDLSQCVNNLTVEGEPQETEKFQQFAGDGAETAFTLTDRPINVRVETPTGTLKTGGIEDSTASYDYEVDAENGIINFLVAPGDGDDVDVTYTYLSTVVATDVDQDSIDKHGEYAKTVKRADLKTVDDAIEYCQRYLDKYATPFLRTVMRLSPTLSDEIDIGNKVHVIDSSEGIDADLVVEKIVLRFPETFDEITVGDKEQRLGRALTTIQFRIEELERAQARDSEITTDIRRVSDEIDFGERYMKVQSRTVSGLDCFILNHATYGILGIGKLGDADISTAADVRIIQGKDTYVEYFYDDDFKSANTTATWNNTTKKATFSYKQKIETSDIYANAAGVNTVKVKASLGKGSREFIINTALPGLQNINVTELP